MVSMDSVTLAFIAIAFLAPTIVLIWTYFSGIQGKLPLLRKRRVSRGKEWGKVIFFGEPKLQQGELQFDATFYLATIKEYDETPEYVSITAKDDIDGSIFNLIPLSKKFNLQQLSYAGTLENNNVFACNVDKNNRVFPWNPILLQKYKQIYDETLEDKIEAKVVDRYRKLFETKNLLQGIDTEPKVREIDIRR